MHLIHGLSARSWRSFTLIIKQTQKSGQCQGAPAFQHGNGATLEIIWPHCTQCSWWSPSPYSCCCNSQASIRLETTSRKTQPHVAQSHCIGSETTEHRSFLCGRRQSLENTGIRMCPWPCSRRVCHEVSERERARDAHRPNIIHVISKLWKWSWRQNVVLKKIARYCSNALTDQFTNFGMLMQNGSVTCNGH